MHSFAILLITFGLSLISARTLPYSGADFSSLLLLESENVKYKTSSTAAPQPFETILADNGANLARIRIWTSSPYDVKYALQLAKRAKAVGMEILVALHLSDTWADPGHQTIPAGWPTDLNGLTNQVYKYTHEVMQAFSAQGTTIDFIQIGNEINDGCLWPVGRASTNGFGPVSQLLHAGALAVHDASSYTKVVIQLSSAWDKGTMSWFLSGAFGTNTKGGLTTSDVDMFGFSQYPYYSTDATFSNLYSAMDYVLSTYEKDIFIVETGFPYACNTAATPLSQPEIPVGSKGQIIWINGIVNVLNKLNLKYPGKALGVVYWEPGWVSNPDLASTCSDVLLVDSDGVTRDSISLFSNI